MLISSNKAGWRIFLTLCTLALGFGIEGWLLSAFQVSKPLWFLTLILLIYISNSGRGATAIAQTWTTGLFIFCILARPWPDIWPSDIPWRHAKLWASILLSLWIFTAWLIQLLAASSDRLSEQAWSRKTRIIGLGGLCWLSMGAGSLFYQFLFTIND